MNNELQHHGILGMKWGVRRYQNKDGSLTKEGKQRYSTISDRIGLAARNVNDKNYDGVFMRTYGGFGKAAKSVAAQDVVNAFWKQDKELNYKDYFNEEERSSMDNSYDKIAKYSNEMTLAAESEREKMLKDPKFMDDIDKELYKEFGTKCNNEQSFIKERDNIVFDKMDENLSKNKNFMTKLSELQNKMDAEYDNLEQIERKIVDRILGDIGDKQVNVSDQKLKYSDIGKSLVDGYVARPAAYLVKNGAEMALYDSEAFMDLDYSMDDYNKKHSN